MNRDELQRCYEGSLIWPFLQTFFHSCPETLLSYVHRQSYAKGTRIIRATQACENVYLLTKGRLQAIEERVGEIPYHFTEFTPVEIIGDYELFTDSGCHYVTVEAAEPSECLVLPGKLYFAWIQKDAQALFARTRLLICQLSSQTQLDRQYLFMDNRSRCVLALLHACSKTEPEGGWYTLPLKREELAGKIGCSLRTAHRLLHHMKEQGEISLVHGKIRISISQQQVFLKGTCSF